MFEEAINSAQGDGIVFSIIVIVFILIATGRYATIDERFYCDLRFGAC